MPRPHSDQWILALETSTLQGSVALCKNGAVQLTRQLAKGTQHGREILPAVDQLLRQAHLSVSSLHAIALGIGPGSFTGLRVGLAAVEGLRFAQKIPVVGIPSFDAMAYHLWEQKQFSQGALATLYYARRQRMYLALYQFRQNSPPHCTQTTTLLPLSQLHKAIPSNSYAIGAGSTYLPSQIKVVTLEEKFSVPRAQDIAQLAWQKLKDKLSSNSKLDEFQRPIQLIYLMKSEAEENLQKKSLL
ncbi:MAG: tRNA (adenosine(37)-N6)-threonylcarbamoyltransferase complex dimerization subunit type 1 TsaB [Planctomycetota bacterium]|nr:MAG: tRNA (adenosine(37)-N6)-threonylcarbamoyltransferase complex dimerization subunit type 1 TsaB [Planctomycetota bacterium]